MSADRIPSAASSAEEKASGTGGPTDGARHYARVALIGGLISLALSPFAVVLGYWLNHALQSPQLKIEYITPIVIVENAKLDWTAVEPIRKDTRLSMMMREVLFRIGYAKSTRRPCTGWLDKNDWTDECTEEVREGIDYLTSLLRARVHELETGLSDMKAGRVPVPMITLADFLPNLAIKDRAKAEVGMQSSLDVTKAQLQLIGEFRRSFDEWVSKESQRTGGLVVRVGILNTGDSDGVVGRSAKIAFGESEVYVRSDQYTVVKAHSFQQVEYRENPAATAQRDLERWHGLVRTRSQDSFTVVLYSGETRLEGKGRLPE